MTPCRRTRRRMPMRYSAMHRVADAAGRNRRSSRGSTMQRATARARGFRLVTGRLVLALVLAGAVGGIAPAPARADDERGRDRHERFDPARAARDGWRYHHRRPVYGAPPPAYVYEIGRASCR